MGIIIYFVWMQSRR